MTPVSTTINKKKNGKIKPNYCKWEKEIIPEQKSMRIRARWQNRKIQPLFLCRDTDLTIIYGTKTFMRTLETSQEPCSTPGRRKVEDSRTEMNENYFTLSPIAPNPNTTAFGKNCSSRLLPGGGREE